jgi:hypothetical protein
MSRIDSWQKFFKFGNQFGTSLSTHIWNVVEIGQCWICAVLWWPFWKWRPVEIFQCRQSIRDIIIRGGSRIIKIWYVGRCPELIPDIEKFYQSPFSKWPLQYCTNSTLSDFNDISYVDRLWSYQILMISDNVEFLRYCGHHFENDDR